MSASYPTDSSAAWRTPLIGGGVGLAAGLAIRYISFDLPNSGLGVRLTAPQWNQLCVSGLGQLAQAGDNTAHTECGIVSFASTASGWLIGLGIAALIIGVLIMLANNSSKA
jgi:hypothetical protein